MTAGRSRQPRERSETLRQAMLRLLREGPATARDLSGQLRISEREVIFHLEHLAKSLRRSDERLAAEPAECLACGYTFARRKRLSKPSACPQCRATRIEAPAFRVDADGS